MQKRQAYLPLKSPSKTGECREGEVENERDVCVCWPGGRGGGGPYVENYRKTSKGVKGRCKSFPRLKPVLNWANVSSRS